MHNEFALHAINEMAFLPRKIVMVLDIQQDLSAQMLGHVLMNERVVGSSVSPHQLHGCPVFLTLRFVERKPGEPAQLLREFRMLFDRKFAVMIANRRASAPASAMAEQSEIFSRRKPEVLILHRESSELNKVVSAPAGPELRPRAITVLLRDRAAAPVPFEDFMSASLLESGPNTKASLRFDGSGEALLLAFKVLRRNIQDGHFHAASDVHTNRIRNNCVISRKHATNGQAVANVGIRHEGPHHGNRQQTSSFHLHDSIVLQALTPLAILGRGGARCRRRMEQRLGEGPSQPILQICGRIPHDRRDLLFQASFIATGENVFRNKVDAAALGFAKRHSKPHQIFCIHEIFPVLFFTAKSTYSEKVRRETLAVSLLGTPFIPEETNSSRAAHDCFAASP